MDHDTVVLQKMTERYLLGELDPNVRDEFEEHYFDCPECAKDVRAAAAFVEQSRVVLAEKVAAGLPLPAATPTRPPWVGWFRPAFAVPVLALLLAFIGYQNFITYPQLKHAASQPQLLAWTSVNVATYGTNAPTITIARGRGFLLFVRIPPNSAYSRYVADLQNPSGKVEWSLTIPATSSQDQWPIQVPGANRESGTYALAVRGITATGESQDVGRTSFDLRIQN